MTEWLAAVLVVIGAAFMLVAAIGLCRFPDLFTRMQAAAKAGSLGLACVMLAVLVHSRLLSVATHAILIVAFVLLTSPVAAHRIARAAHRIGVPQWTGTQRDELHDAISAEAADRAAEELPASGEDDPDTEAP
jgi:multicomponent Na+:H+ antiporter subunit G